MLRVGTAAAGPDFKMAVRTGGKAGAAHVADSISLGHGLSFTDCHRGHMSIQGLIAVAVIDDHTVAIAVAGIAGADHSTGIRGHDGRAVTCAHIQPTVVFLRFIDGMDPQPESAGDVRTGGHRPGKGARTGNLGDRRRRSTFALLVLLLLELDRLYQWLLGLGQRLLLAASLGTYRTGT